jgi:hypothetical protein
LFFAFLQARHLEWGILVLTLETLFARAGRTWNRSIRQRGRSNGPARRWARLRLDQLEERAVPATFQVNSLGDTGAGSGTTGDLRYAINQSNGTPGANTITFAPGIAGTISLTSQLPPITNDVTIQGPGKENLVIDGGSMFRVLEIGQGVNVVLAGVQIANAAALPTWQARPVDLISSTLFPFDHDNLAKHIHSYWNIFINGQLQQIPANTGITPDNTQFHEMHTHDRSGTIHMESKDNPTQQFFVHDFFDVWGQDFTPTRLLDYRVDPAHPIMMLVNGVPNSDMGNYEIQDMDHIDFILLGATLDTTIPNAIGQGGGILNAGNLTLRDSLIIACRAQQGGGIYNTGTLTMTNSEISGCGAIDAGGGIFSTFGATVTVTNSTVDGDYGTTGGGIQNNNGNLTVNFSTVRGNLSTDTFADDGIAGGGGIYNYGGSATISNSLLSGNSAANNGGGVYNNSAQVTISNSTLSSNTADSKGGAIYNDPSSTLSLVSDTAAQNTTSGQGGGVFSDTTIGAQGSVTLDNNIIARNTNGGNSDDLSGPIVSHGFNLIGNGSNGSGFVFSDRVGTASTPIDPLLGTLADNGGPTLSYSLQTGSPAIGTGDPSLAGSTDQRGFVRGNPVNIGSFQPSAGPTATISPVATPRTAPAGVVTITFSTAVTGVSINAFTLTLNGAPVSLAGLNVTQVNPSTYTIDLTSVTAAPGSYVFTLVAAGSGIQDASHTALAGNAAISFSVTTGTIGPTASIVQVPTPRTTPAGVVTINFSEAVVGVTINAFRLTQNGNNVPLTGLTVTQVTPSQYTVDLTSVTTTLASYVFTLVAAGSGIHDSANNPLASNASTSFQVTAPSNPPTATIVPVTTPRANPVGVVTINFSTAVRNVTIDPFSLTRDGVGVPLTGLALVTVSPSQYTIDLTTVTALAGNYVFTLTAANSGIQDLMTFVAMTTNATLSFQVTSTTNLQAFAEPGVFNPLTATWYLRGSKSSGAPDSGTFGYGLQNWEPVVGDFTGSRKSTIGVVDPSGFRDVRNRRDAFWFLGSANGVNDIPAFAYGFASWAPITGSWNGSGLYGIGAYDPATATFYLRNETSSGAPDAGVFQFGAPGWIPLAGDWTGSGRFGIGVFDPTTATFYLRNELSAGAPDAGVFHFGLPFWKPVVGDWNGDGTWTIGVVDPSGARDTVNHRDAYWFLSNDNQNVSYTPFAYGFAAWTPVSGDWNFPNSKMAAVNRSGSASLTDDQLQTAVTTALDQLQNANVAVTLLERLASVQFTVGVLGGGLLSQTDAAGQQVTVDATAAGRGWSVGSTAGSNGRIDLLGVVFADLEHIASQDGVDAVTLDGLSPAGPADAVFTRGL